MEPTETRYPALRRYVSETPWALEPSSLLLLQEVIGRRIQGDRLTAEEIAEIAAAAPRRTATPSQGSVAVLPLWGILSPHAVEDISSGPTTALDTWGALFDELDNDPSVGTIVLNVDSPGGAVDLVPEVAAKIRAARTATVAVANTRAASAAYWLASQCGELVVSPSGAVGSVGVYAAHEDVSRQLEAEGVTVTLISAGEHKVDGNPFEPLSDAARATIQANVDAYYGMFLRDVAKGRGVDVGFAQESFGKGKMLLAAEAVRAGMADRVGTLEDTIARLLKGQPATKRARAAAVEPAIAAATWTAATGSNQSGVSVTVAPGGRIAGTVPPLALAAAQELERTTITMTPPAAADTPPDDEAAGPAGGVTPTSEEPVDDGEADIKDSGAPAGSSAASGGDHNTRKEIHMDGVTSREELVARREEIRTAMTELDSEAAGRALTETEQAQFDALTAEANTIDETVANIDQRKARLEALNGSESAIPAVAKIKKPGRGGIHSNVDSRIPENPFALEEYRSVAKSIDDMQQLQTAGALQIAENVRFVGSGDKTAAHDRVEDVLRGDEKAEFARRVILTANPAYDRAFGKAVMRGRDSLTTQEDQLIKAAISESGLGSETPIPITIDPTVMLTSNGQTNPLRAVADVRTITGLTWRGITSAGITAAYESAEGNEVADSSPTFGGGDISVLRVDAFVPFSIEVDMDWPALRAELAKEFADAKDVLEGVKFFTGSGTNEPTGLITALTAATALVKTATTAVFAYTDPALASNALPVRWDQGAQWFAAKSTWATLQDLLAAAGNSDPFSYARGGAASPTQSVGGGNVGQSYRGYPMNYASAMDTAVTTSGKNIMVIGDPKAYTIVDRIGMNIELIPHVFHTSNNRPSGQRGLFAYWRNNANIRTTNAFQILQVK